MRTAQLKLKTDKYSIIVGSNAIKKLPLLLKGIITAKNIVVITNPLIKRICAKKINAAFKNTQYQLQYLLIPDAEKSKSFTCFSQAVSRIAKLIENKPTFIIALGGGVVGDLSGFVAHVYKRGIPYIQVPTTLLAQVDSAIGGKTAIDLDAGKNLVGAFNQPRLVLSDIDFLKSLSKREIKSGLAEVIKYGVIMDKQLFNYLEKNYLKVISLNKSALEYIVYRSSLNKAKIVALDEKETKGIRTILNFGHTVGHAIETAGGYNRYSHGEAIAVGMVAACNLSVKLRLIERAKADGVVNLISKVGLPTQVKNIKLSKILSAMEFDKKFIHGQNRFVLIKDIGKTVIKEKINPLIIKEVIKDVLVS